MHLRVFIAAIFLTTMFTDRVVAIEARNVQAAGDVEPAVSTDFFGLVKLHNIEIEISADEYQAMQPPARAAFFGAPVEPARLKKPGDRESERNLFGMEFPWVHGAVVIDGKAFKNVGLRYTGNVSYLASAGGLKRSILVDLDRFERVDSQEPRCFELESGVLDPSRARESLAFKLFRESGVAAPRTARAEAILTVPGKYEKAYLGVYTVVESIDRAFLKNRFHAENGFLVQPWGARTLEYLGDDWEKYRERYRTLAEPTAEQATRFTRFLKLVDRADDDQFRKEIGLYLDIDNFLRFMAAQAMIANADGFFTLNLNYYLFLDPKTNRFVFIPGDQGSSFANFAIMGSADRLMNMSLYRPYGGENRPVDRLLAMKEVRDAQRKILTELASTVFDKERLLADIKTIDDSTRELIRRENASRVERVEPPIGFGPPGAPTAPDLITFVEKRSISIADQLAGKKTVYHPRFNFGPPGGNTPLKPIDKSSIDQIVKSPPGFQVSLFAAPPQVGYPVAVSVAPDGAVYVAVDEQGSLGRTPGGGRVMRCVDDDGDGVADRVNEFAKMDHPRGLIAQEGAVWVMHPPFLSVFRDQNGDGVSDSQEILVSGLTTSQIDTRGGDHTTNGIRMGIDGWIYIAVGDYGFHNATGKDGTKLSQRGGGILRVRPDGRELEVFAVGLRNPFAIAIDPYMNLFTRDNTNDGAGWDVRLSHLIQSADYGYPLRFMNYTDEIMPPLGAFGQGSGTGALYIQDDRLPDAYRDVLLTGDWGRNEVYRHELKQASASFRANSSVFLSIPRPTGMDCGDDGRIYVASWRGGEASVYIGPEVGFVAAVVPPGSTARSHVNPKEVHLDQLINGLCGPNAISRFNYQREIIRRGGNPQTARALADLAFDRSKSLAGRVAAIFALKQLEGVACHATLRKLGQDATVREFVLKALADRKSELEGVDSSFFINALTDSSPRVRGQAIIALGRLGDVTAAKHLIPSTSRSKDSSTPTARPVHARPDPDRTESHVAMRSLIALKAIDACLEAIEGPHHEGAFRVLRSLHDPKTVDGLIKKLNKAQTPEIRRGVLETLVRLYHREAEYQGSWWGIRPDTNGPYFDPREWECSRRIDSVLTAAVLDDDIETSKFLRDQLNRMRVHLKGLSADFYKDRPKADDEQKVIIAKVDPNNTNQIGNMNYETVVNRALRVKGNPERGKHFFSSLSCRACHTDADGQTPKGPHLVDIGKRYNASELAESILRPSAKIAQGYETYGFATTDGHIYTGFIVSESSDAIQIRETTGSVRELKLAEIDERVKREGSTMPEGIAASLTPEQLADLIAYLQSLRKIQDQQSD